MNGFIKLKKMSYQLILSFLLYFQKKQNLKIYNLFRFSLKFHKKKMLWDNNLPMTEKKKREDYLKMKISEAFSLFYDKKKNQIDKK